MMLQPPRLLTGELGPPGPEAAPTQPHPWLLVVASLVALATLAWWVWWFFRFRKAKLDESEAAFRRLSRIVGLGHADCERLRALCIKAGVDPLATLGSPTLAATVLQSTPDTSARQRRLWKSLCGTFPGDGGIPSV